MYEGGEREERKREDFDFAVPLGGLGMGLSCYFQALLARCSCRGLRVNHLSSIPRPSSRRDKDLEKQNEAASDWSRLYIRIPASLFSFFHRYCPGSLYGAWWQQKEVN